MKICKSFLNFWKNFLKFWKPLKRFQKFSEISTEKFSIHLSATIFPFKTSASPSWQLPSLNATTKSYTTTYDISKEHIYTDLLTLQTGKAHCECNFQSILEELSQHPPYTHIYFPFLAHICAEQKLAQHLHRFTAGKCIIKFYKCFFA